MFNFLLSLLAVTTVHASLSIPTFFQKKTVDPRVALVHGALHNPAVYSLYGVPLNEVSQMLRSQHSLSEPVINKVLTSLSCADQYKIHHKNILTVIDYSLPSNQKRFWVFNLREKRLLFHTYVSHGITSGALFTNFFSNKYNSKASSIGVYKTKKAYYGREGLSLQLAGLDVSFNDNAENRAIVMHSGWYVEEDFIKKYGRAGRSWGCPAVPPKVSSSIINTIKDSSFFVIYYPSDRWFAKSKFLNCQQPSSIAQTVADNQAAVGDEPRGSILFADMHKNNAWQENDPVVVMAAENYQKLLHKPAPVNRMLRRQINHIEYIVLNSNELNQLIRLTSTEGTHPEVYRTLNFVVPDIVKVRGYYETLMKPVNLGKIKEIKSEGGLVANSQYTIHFEARASIILKSTDQFIRWVGL